MRERMRKGTDATTASETGSQKERGTSPAEHGEDIKRAIDDLLDEIDSVLEENAAEFVAGYVQRGGE